jgi:hypothetical protein
MSWRTHRTARDRIAQLRLTMISRVLFLVSFVQMFVILFGRACHSRHDNFWRSSLVIVVNCLCSDDGNNVVFC